MTAVTSYAHDGCAGKLTKSWRCSVHSSTRSGAQGAGGAVGADPGDRPEEFRPPDDVLGLAGANPALPPIRLLHVGWRWYDPSLGRFLQRVPVGLRGGMNPYLYAGAGPLARIDPCGLGDWTNPFGVDDPVTTGDPLRRAFINITGGRHSWLDDPHAVKQVQVTTAVVAGIVCMALAPPWAAAALGVGGAAWGGYRLLGGDTGTGLDPTIDGFVEGNAIGGLLRPAGPNPRRLRRGWHPGLGPIEWWD